MKITPCLWFDTEGEEAARFYTSIFADSRITGISRFPEAARERPGREPGSVLTVAFELNGQSFTALNGGPQFKFTQAVSLQIECETQEEVDYYWEKLGEGGDPESRQCGWIKDKFGLSWQVVPKVLPELLMDSDPARAERVFIALLGMQKLDIAALLNAAGPSTGSGSSTEGA
jgi:predicted 3-demethylubiquinone-9 3-methyltransferase (glyoxalase superfamily)